MENKTKKPEEPKVLWEFVVKDIKINEKTKEVKECLKIFHFENINMGEEGSPFIMGWNDKKIIHSFNNTNVWRITQVVQDTKCFKQPKQKPQDYFG